MEVADVRWKYLLGFVCNITINKAEIGGEENHLYQYEVQFDINLRFTSGSHVLFIPINTLL